jgi:aminoglycoside phosphotransferase (APT) family kinase protein
MIGISSETIKTRPGEELDTECLSAYLSSELGFSERNVGIEQFPSGSSNLTYLVKIGDDSYVLRRPPFGNTVKTAHDMRREYDVLSKLSSVYTPAPKPLLFCDDDSVIGSEFYLMERRRGLVVRGEFPQPHKLADENERLAVCRSFIANLADLHAIDYSEAGLVELGKPEGYCRRQVQGWTKRYFAAKSHEIPELVEVIGWLNNNIPTESGARLQVRQCDARS